jgi:magnesium transporter
MTNDDKNEGSRVFDNGEIDQIVAAAEEDASSAAKKFSHWHVADIIEAFNRMPREVDAALLRHLDAGTALSIFNSPGLDRPQKLIEQLPEERAISIFERLHPDRRAEIFRKMPAKKQTRLLGKLSTATRSSLQKILKFPADQAGGIMTTEFVSVPITWTISQALEHIRQIGGASEQIYAVYLIDPQSQKLKQTSSLRRLLIANPSANVSAAAPAGPPITVSPTTDREEVARLISKYDLLAVPVLDEAGKILGIVTVDDVIDAIVAESTEDVQRFGGVEALNAPYMSIGFLAMIKKRAGWLSALFLSEMLTASAMQHYSTELERAVVLTLFIPLIMSSGGNSGSQATSLVIRALALRELKLSDWWRVARREIPTGLVLGSILGAIGIVRIVLWQKLGIYDYGEHWLLVAATVGAALIGIVMFGSLAGSTLPFILKKLGFDPASASAPFVATLVDVTGLVIYFSIALVILRGTLL